MRTVTQYVVPVVLCTMKRKAKSQPNARKSKKKLQTVDVDVTINSVASQSQSQTTESVPSDADLDGLDVDPDGGFIETATTACNKLQSEVSSLRSVVVEQSHKIDNIEKMLTAILELLQKDADRIPSVTVSANMESSVSQPVVSASVSASSAVPLYSDIAGRGTDAGRGIESTVQNKLSTFRLDDTVAAVYVDQHEHSRRANNIIISGLHTVPGVSDREVASALIETEYDFVPHISYVRRLGQVLPGRIRPLLVTMKHDEASWLVNRATDLRNSDEPIVRKSVYINADLTRAEAAAAYEIRCRRRRSRAAKVAKTAAASGPDAELPGRTFVNRGLRGGAAAADYFSLSGSVAAVGSVVAPASIMNLPLATGAATSVQPPAPSPSTQPANLSGAVVAGFAAMETESVWPVAALSASVLPVVSGQSATSPTTTSCGRVVVNSHFDQRRTDCRPTDDRPTRCVSQRDDDGSMRDYPAAVTQQAVNGTGVTGFADDGGADAETALHVYSCGAPVSAITEDVAPVAVPPTAVNDVSVVSGRPVE